VTADAPTFAYTDGACSGNPGPGGWAWAIPGGAWASGAENPSTNQRMEITAAWRAVEANPGRLEVVSDSTYVVNCFRDRWWEGWLARGWKNSQRKPVANRDLWEPFVSLVRDRIAGGEPVGFRWVKGHSGDVMNDLVDRLAVEAATTQRGRSGTEPPGVVGPPDRVPFVAQDEPVLPGWSLAAFGPRAKDLADGGIGEAEVRTAIGEALASLHAAHDDLAVVSGLRLGGEMLAAEAALAQSLPVVAVLPYPDPEVVWDEHDRTRFRALRDAALDVVLLERAVPPTRRAAAAALARRDAWLARHAAAALVVRCGDDEALARLTRSLQDHLGDEVTVLDLAAG
jgi:ribonuclease HI